MLAARAASRRSLATLRLVSAPIRGPEMAGAAGVVEQAEGDLAKGDLVFAPTLRCAWGDAATVTVDAKALVKVPPSVPPAQAAHLGAAAAAAALLDGAVAGDVVLHLGGEGAVGQVAAQLCAARGVSLVSLVGADVADAEDAVEVLKNLGAVCAAPKRSSLSASIVRVVHTGGRRRVFSEIAYRRQPGRQPGRTVARGGHDAHGSRDATVAEGGARVACLSFTVLVQ